MTSQQTRTIEVLQDSLGVALRHQSNLDADAGVSIHKEHKQHVARIQRKLNKATKEANQ